MPIELNYPSRSTSGVPLFLREEAIWMVALRVRRAILGDRDDLALQVDTIVDAASNLVINGREVATTWEFRHAVHDGCGRPVLGACETDPDAPGIAMVSVNPDMVAHRPDLTLSTMAHELGHVVFDVPAALGGGVRHFRSYTVNPGALLLSGNASERRANEFMGALLVPPVPLHTRLLALARAEGARLVRAPHWGRPASPVLAGDNPPDIIAGIVAVAASEFGVSDRFIAVRMDRYGLLDGARS